MKDFKLSESELRDIYAFISGVPVKGSGAHQASFCMRIIEDALKNREIKKEKPEPEPTTEPKKRPDKIEK